jgi:DNA-3-methyladenine glycosylase II
MTTQLRERHRTVLAATQPFSLARSLRALDSFAPCAGDQFVADGRVRKALLRPGGGPDEAVVVEVGAAPHGPPGASLVAYARSPLDTAEAAGIELAVRRWLGLDDELGPFLAIASADPPMAPVLAATAGLHQVRFATLAEGATYFALTQRSTQWFAAARKRRIAAQLGPRAELDGQTYLAYPSLTTVRALDVDGWIGFAGNRQRAVRLVEVLEGLADLDEEWLRTAPFTEVRATLLAVRGVGAFTADAILLRVLGRPDHVPLEMAQFAQTAAAVYGADPPAPAQLRERYGSAIGWWAYLSRMGLSWAQADSRAAAEAGTAQADSRATAGADDGDPGPAEHADGHDAAATLSSQRSNVRTPQPVAPLASSPSAESAQAGADMSTWTQRSRSAPANSRRYSAAITEPPPTSVELTRSATSLSSASR